MDERYELDRGAVEVIRRLEAYADARLDPSVAATTRMRAAVMAAAHRQAALIAADGATALALAPAEVAPHRALGHSRRVGAWRRPVAAMLAGTLTLGILAGTALAARPGGPLYQARLWTEAANLPAAGLARAHAEVARLQARIDEAESAAMAGDARGVVAAIDAYAVIVTEAATGTEGDVAAGQLVEATVSRHVIILTALLQQVPATARDAIEHALAASTNALDDIHVRVPSAGGNKGSGGTGGNGATNGGTGGNGATNGGSGADSGSGGGGGNAGGDNAAAAAGGAAGGGQDPASSPTPKAPKPTPPGQDRTPRPTSSHLPPGQQSGPSDPPSENSQH
jgi:hypothetical protein